MKTQAKEMDVQANKMKIQAKEMDAQANKWTFKEPSGRSSKQMDA